MQKFRIPYIPYRSLLLSTTILNGKVTHACYIKVLLTVKYVKRLDEHCSSAGIQPY